MKKFKPVQFINKETGEVFTSEQIITKFAVVEDSKPTYRSIKLCNNNMFNIGGYYFHLLFKNTLDKTLEENYLIRFCKLCTNLDTSNTLVSSMRKGKKNLTEKDLEKIWNLSKRETINTKQYLIENKLIFIGENGTIKINKDYAIKGAVSGNSNMTRVFENGFNELYEGVSARQHGTLAIFIKLLPYLNSEFNVLCENPNETNKELIKAFRWSEVCEKLGLNKEQAKKIKAKLFKMKINGKYAIGEFTNGKGKKIVVNPSVFWKSNANNISDVAKLFEI